jgi:hypothetical protein
MVAIKQCWYDEIAYKPPSCYTTVEELRYIWRPASGNEKPDGVKTSCFLLKKRITVVRLVWVACELQRPLK